jgi:ADP-ribose pyrophosphatase YjhB (NUDIX family)/predicted RNase H-like HicB family nuclease
MTWVVHLQYVVEQDEDGAWCASASLRPGVAAFGDGPTREAAVADLRAGLELLIEEVGPTDELTLTVDADWPGRRVPPMTRRIDYFDDPAAPAANSMVPSANVVVVNDSGKVLMIRRTDNDNWAVPGGEVDLGESVAQAAIRETREESDIDCEITGLVGIYSNPKHVILYTSNGEARQEFSIVLTARQVSSLRNADAKR